jgi:multicomponent Na+:H+ antiporter subunit A
VPLLFGFVSKEYFYKALLAAGQPEVLWETLGVGASVVMVALAVTTAWKPFWGALKPTPKQAHEAPWTMWLGPVLLGVASLKTGLLPGVASFHLLEPAVHAVLGNQIVDVHLKLWHGWTLALALSGLTLVLGVALYFQLPRARLFRPLGEKLASFGPERGYDKILSGVLAFGRWQTDVLQNGYLRNYILTIVIFTAALICWALAESLPELVWPAMGQPDVLTVTVCLLMIAGSIFACITQSRFNAILALGVVGLGVAMIYFLFSAPDLAMTQVLVETLTLVLFVLAFYRLPLFGKYSKPATRWRDAVLALVFGTVMAFVVLAEQAGKHTNYEVSRFYGDNSLLEAQGRNVVNVILVDFRALDTLGEISVLAIAALGVVAMLKMRPRGRRQEDQS